MALVNMDAHSPTKEDVDALLAQIAGLETEIRDLESTSHNVIQPLRQKITQLSRNEASLKQEASDRRGLLQKAQSDLDRLEGQVGRLTLLERSVKALRYVVAAQRRAIILAYTKYAYNKQGTGLAQTKEKEAAGRLEKLIESITRNGVDAEGKGREFETVIGAKKKEIDAIRIENEKTADDLALQYDELETAEKDHYGGIENRQEELKAILEEYAALRDVYDEFKKLETDLQQRYDKAEIEVVRESVNDVMARCEEELTDIERIKSDSWQPGIRINLIQYLSVEWESFNHQMRVSTQEKTGVQLLLLPRPFAKGTFRSAWYAKDSNGNEYIAKKFHASWRKELNEFMSDKTEEAGRKRDRDSVDKVIRMNRVCQVALQAFDQALKSVRINFELSFVDIWMAEETDTGNVWFLEEALPKFDRFTNNADFADDTTEQGRLMGCFEHFSLEHYGRRFIVTDLQGFQEGTVFRLSDPALHILSPNVALSSIQHFMDGNRGIAGFADLLKKHKCNEFCNALRLPPLPKYEDLMRTSGPVGR